MKVEINNCNNIEHAVVEIEPNYLNIKFGSNGTGKSTIAKAIRAFVDGDQDAIRHMLPFKYKDQQDGHMPTVKGFDSIKQIRIFDEDYLSRFVFAADEFVPKTFEVFVKTKAYDEQMTQIEMRLSKIQSIFSTSKEIGDLIGHLYSFCEAFGNATKGYSKASHFAKGLLKGNTVANVPKGLDVFSSYIHSDNRNYWLKWHKQGDDLIVKEEHRCPYCAHIMSAEEEMLLEMLAEKYDAKAVEHLINTVSVFKNLAQDGLSVEAAKFVNQIVEKANEISTDEIARLVRIKTQAALLLGRLDNMKKFDFYGITSTPDKAKKIADELDKLHLDPNDYPELLTEKTKKIMESLNSAIDETLKSVRQLQSEVELQQLLIAKTIRGNESAINEFMKLAGYPYSVSIDNDGGGHYRTHLCHVDCPKGEISDPRAHLSFGERNAFALAMFVYDVAQNYQSDMLIVLDDPISSFDGNKKFALLNLMFLNGEEKTLKGKTVMMLTHDFCPVIDAVRIQKKLFGRSVKAWYLCCSGGTLVEKVIRGECIVEAVRLNKKNMQNEEVDPLIRIVYFRRWKELRGEATDSLCNASYHIVSSVMHLRPVPTDDAGNPIPAEEVQKGLDEIRLYIKNFDYDQILENVKNREYLKNCYNRLVSHYEKLLVFRYMEKNGWIGDLPGILKKYMNEPFHVENDYVCQLNPKRYELIPDSQMSLFDEIVAQKIN